MTDPDDSLYMPRRLAVQLMHAAQSRPEEEVCGLVAAVDDAPGRFLPVRNIADDPARRFEMDPAGLTRAMADIRERGQTLWAVFHSHPGAPAEPSDTDRRLNGYPEALTLIASLNIRGVLELRCWEDADGTPRERVLRIRD